MRSRKTQYQSSWSCFFGKPQLTFVVMAGLLISACQTRPLNSTSDPRQGMGRVSQIFVLRLRPADDVRATLEKWAQDHEVKAASIVSSVGSVRSAAIRYADQKDSVSMKGPFEVVAMSGLISRDGLHVHIAVSDATGKTWGGHLGAGTEVYTTLELVLGIYKDMEFLRRPDPSTGYKELEIH